jgi:hypothetical protein
MRTTPAGLVAVGVMVAAILLSITALVRTARQRTDGYLANRDGARLDATGQNASTPRRASTTKEG